MRPVLMSISVALADPDPLLIDCTALTTPDKTLFPRRFPRQSLVLATDKADLLRADTVEKRAHRSCGPKDMAEVLRIARLKFGDHIQVSGDMPFKTAVVEAAVDTEQPVTFADPEMEKRRQVLHSLKHPPPVVVAKKKEAVRQPTRGRDDGGWSIADDLYDDFGR